MEKKNNKCQCGNNCECGDNCQCGSECHCNDKVKKESHKSKKENNELNKLKEQNKDLTDKVLRLSAEIQNIGKRHADEISNIAKYEGIDLIKKLLPVVDNFERAIEMDNSVNEKYLEGYKMIYTNLLNILESIGVKTVECQDKEFDPNTMEAIMTEHVDGVEPNYVLLVLQKGYIYKDKIIRHAFVKVSE